VLFEVELDLEGVVDGLDDLAQRLEEPGSGPRGPALAGGAEQVRGCSDFEVRGDGIFGRSLR
jgi:hypothetical protein